MNRFLPCLSLLFVSTISNQFAAAQPLLPPQPLPRPVEQPAFGEPAAPPREPTLHERKAWREGFFAEHIVPPFKEFCYSCHSDQKALAGLNLQRLKPDFENPATVEIWQRVYERIRDGEMPPDAKKTPPPKPVADPLLPGIFFERPPVKHRRAEFGSLDLLFSKEHLLYPQLLKQSEPLVIRADETPLVRLQKQLRNTTLQRAQEALSMHELGTVEFAEVAASMLEFSNAELALATTKEQRVACLTRTIAAWRLLERAAYTRFEGGRTGSEPFLIAKSGRLTAQIRLQAELDKK